MTNWELTFKLKSGTKVTDSMDGVATQTNRTVKVTPPSWGLSVPAGRTVTAFGFCAKGTGDATDVALIAR